MTDTGETFMTFGMMRAECEARAGVSEITRECARAIVNHYRRNSPLVAEMYLEPGHGYIIPNDPRLSAGTVLWRALFAAHYERMPSDERVIADMLGTYLANVDGQLR